MNESSTNSMPASTPTAAESFATSGHASERINGATIHNTQTEVPPTAFPLECTGRAAEALQAFREREATLKSDGQKKPDMVAFKELRHEYVPERQHGQIDGVPVGVKLQGRGEAAILGLHTQILRGIDAVQGEACYAICIAGKYPDDDDHSNDGTIVYTGEGGQKKKNRDVQDQKTTVGNAALIRSIDTQQPIRVLRGRQRSNEPPEYYYDGLYKCIAYKYETGTEGPLVFKFTLKPIENESKARSITVESTKTPSKGGGSKSRLLHHKRKRRDVFVGEQRRKDSTRPFSV